MLFLTYTSLQRKENYGSECWYFTSTIGLFARTMFVYHFIKHTLSTQSVTFFLLRFQIRQYINFIYYWKINREVLYTRK